MKTSLQTFTAGVDELLAFLANTEREAQLVVLLLDKDRQAALAEAEKSLLTQIAAARTDRKRYIYCVAIVSLYGLLERLVDSLVAAFVERIAGLVDTYQAMPDAIKKNHVPMSLELVKAIMEERHREGIAEADVIANLHSCLSGATLFRINGPAFVLHRGNITLAKISGFLTSVGVESHNRRVTLAQPLNSFLRDREPERDIANVADQDLPALLDTIDDLVERRNQVSHGVINVDEIESVELLESRCRFVKAYGAALYDVLSQEVLRFEILRPTVQALGKPIAVYGDAIVCFESTQCKISVGNQLIAATGNSQEPFRRGPVISLQIDGVDYTDLNITEPTKFGARVSYRASMHYNYYAMSQDFI